jgi:signal peptidase I
MRHGLRGPWSPGRLATWAFFGVVGVCLVAVAAGYRPFIITSGSMGVAAPSGSLVVAAPRDQVEVGDILVMRREGALTVTHRVVAIEQRSDSRYAITRGDANDTTDPVTYLLEGSDLVERWTIPRLGAALSTLKSPYVLLVLLAGSVTALTAAFLSAVWSDPEQMSDNPSTKQDIGTST